MGLLNQRLFGNPGAGNFNQKQDVDLMDTSSTSLPVGSQAPSADSVAMKNHQKILYTNLTSGANQIYVVSGIGDPNLGAQFALDQAGSQGAQFAVGDSMWIKAGAANGEKLMCWNGASFQELRCPVGGQLQVTNAVSATTPGSVVKKVQIFDANGNSLGFLAVYSSIS